MALRIRRVKRALGIGKAKTDKYLIVPDRATVVSFEHLCDQVAATIGMNKAIVRAVLSGVVNGRVYAPEIAKIISKDRNITVPYTENIV